MKIILLQDIKNLGKKYDVKSVSDGYARNFLFPKKLARVADLKSLKELENLRKDFEKKQKEKIEFLEKLYKKNISTKPPLVFKSKISKGKHLFGSVSASDIEEKLTGEGLKNIKVNLKQPIKTLGDYNIEIDLGEGVKKEIEIKIEAE